MRDNDRTGRGRYTIPSPKLYPHQWAWDSAFAALGWAYIEPERAWDELDSLMANQWEDGRVPHIAFHDLEADYFPGPAFWQTEQSSTISQPPVWASMARVIADIAPSDRLQALLPKFEASHRFFVEQRDPLHWGAVAMAHPWESGLDNSPAWDAALERVDVSEPPEFERRDLHATQDASVRPTNDQYLRYACLVKAIANDNFGIGPFAVYDPMFTAILARAERDLAELCKVHGVETQANERAERLEAGLEKLWRPALGRYVYHDARASEDVTHDLVGCYLPLWAQIPEERRVTLLEGLNARFAPRFRVPSCSASDPAYEPRRYWRGPTWLNVNWLLARSVPTETGRLIAQSTIELVRQSGLREYFHSETGEGLGGESFSWSAALTLDFIKRPI